MLAYSIPNVSQRTMQYLALTASPLTSQHHFQQHADSFALKEKEIPSSSFSRVCAKEENTILFLFMHLFRARAPFFRV